MRFIERFKEMYGSNCPYCGYPFDEHIEVETNDGSDIFCPTSPEYERLKIQKPHTDIYTDISTLKKILNEAQYLTVQVILITKQAKNFEAFVEEVQVSDLKETKKKIKVLNLIINGKERYKILPNGVLFFE